MLSNVQQPNASLSSVLPKDGDLTGDNIHFVKHKTDPFKNKLSPDCIVNIPDSFQNVQSINLGALKCDEGINSRIIAVSSAGFLLSISAICLISHFADQYTWER